MQIDDKTASVRPNDVAEVKERKNLESVLQRTVTIFPSTLIFVNYITVNIYLSNYFLWHRKSDLDARIFIQNL